MQWCNGTQSQRVDVSWSRRVEELKPNGIQRITSVNECEIDSNGDGGRRTAVP